MDILKDRIFLQNKELHIIDGWLAELTITTCGSGLEGFKRGRVVVKPCVFNDLGKTLLRTKK